MSIYISGMVMMPSEDDYVAVVVYGDGTIRSIFGSSQKWSAGMMVGACLISLIKESMA